LNVPTRNVSELGLSTLNASRTRRLVDWPCSALLALLGRVLRLRLAVFPEMVTWLTPGLGSPLTPPLELTVEAEPAEMLAAQQTATRPTDAVAATRR
jgi:hypothetical protein